MREELELRVEALAKATTSTTHWRDKLSPDDTQSALVLEDLIGKFLLNTVGKEAK